MVKQNKYKWLENVRKLWWYYKVILNRRTDDEMTQKGQNDLQNATEKT